MKFCHLIAALLLLCSSIGVRAEWTLVDGANEKFPGRKVDIKDGERLVAQFIYGEDQIKPYLHVFGDEGDWLTEWSPKQSFPHHRGIYIGWNRISSDLGTFDLWHFNNGGKMSVVKFEQLQGGRESARLVATIEWRGGKKDTNGSDLLLTETRTLVISRPESKRTQVDAAFRLRATRDLNLGGDLQHAGIHFRGSTKIQGREKETAYLWEPDVPGPGGKVSSKEAKWARLVFPIGSRWYAATEFNAPENPVEEISWRNYGRFGFFFKRAMKKDETLALNYRFITEQTEAPAETGKLSEEQKSKARAEAQARYAEFTRAKK
jgi:hypothetical protein